MTSPVKVIYHCSTGRLSGWAAALHLGGLSSDLTLLRPFFERSRSGRLPGEFVLIGTDDAGHQVFAWEHGHSHKVFQKAFASMNQIFGIREEMRFVGLNLPGIRLGMIAMMNAFTDYGDTEVLRWARADLEVAVSNTILSLKGTP